MHLILAAFLLAASADQPQPTPPTRPVVRTAADLPQTRHPVPEPPSRYVFTEAFARDLLPRLRADAERALVGSDFVEITLRRQLASGLAAIAVLQNRPSDAERVIAAQRAVENQPQLRALVSLNFDALAAATAAPPAERCAAGARRITERLAGTNPIEARQEVALRWSQMQLTSRAFDGAGLQDVDRNAARLGGISLLEGMTMARIRAATDLIPPCRDRLSAALRTWLDDPAHAEPNIWPERESPAAAFASAAPVTVAVWDTGLDYTLFAGQLAIDPAEPLDGRDNDGNGVVDDVHGPTFDARLQPSPAPLQPLSEPLADRYLAAATLAQGESDHRFGLDTAHARLFALHARSASLEEQAIDVRLGAELGYRSHGTFIGSQIAEGLPFVRLYNMRMIPYGRTPDPVPVAEAEIERWIAQLRPMLRRMRAAGVRVANLSWSHVDDGGEGLLENGLETDPARARQRSRAMYERLRAAMIDAFKEAPDVLFVSAAGNDGSRNEDIQPLPDSLGLPNHVIVGAVGPGGGPASFTSIGERVRLYANGGRARGRAPGGGWDHSGGTSMAAPLVVRTAAQMLAVNPRLTPAQLIEGMIATATANAQNLRLIHPAAAVQWARRGTR
jgi:subtilisin family serine protease